MKLIFATDFSESATIAGVIAAKLAHHWHDTLAVSHVIDPSLCREVPTDVRHTLAAFTNDRLHDTASQFRQQGISVEEHMLAGIPDKALEKLALQSETRLIITGSLGHRPAEWLLGSVAEHLVAFSPVPTLIVRSEGAFGNWPQNKKALKIFIAFDFTETAENALRWVKHLVAIGPCEIVIGYVDWPFGQGVNLGFGYSQFASQNSPEVRKVIQRELTSRARALLGECPLRVRSETCMGRPDLRLIEMAKEEKTDLLLTGTHQRHGLDRLWEPSVAEALIRNAPMSVLSVPVRNETPIKYRCAKIQRVLLAVDLVKNNNRTVPYAYGILASGGVVKIVHVVAPYNPPNVLSSSAPQTFKSQDEYDRFLEDTLNHLDALAPADADKRGIITESEVLENDDVPKALQQAANQFGADLICMGAHNQKGHSHHTLGAINQALLQHSQHPILLAPDPAS